MFLVELSFNTVKKEIEELDNKRDRKENAIKSSFDQLEEDNTKLIKFIEKDQIKTSKKEKGAKQAMRDCQILQDKNKEYDNLINNIKSDISKQKDVLNSLEENKNFILELSEIQSSNWVKEEERKRDYKKETIKRRWIDEHKRDTRDDHIIFRDTDDLYSFEAFLKSGGGQMAMENSSVADGSEKAGVGQAVGGAVNFAKQRKNANLMMLHQLKRENMTDRDWEIRFEFLFNEDLIAVDENFYSEELCFKDAHDLDRIFLELEE